MFIIRIDALNQIERLYGINGNGNVGKASKSSRSDKLEISSFGKDLQVAKQAVAQAPDIRKDKVEYYRKAIADGSWQVSAEAFANKMLEETLI